MVLCSLLYLPPRAHRVMTLWFFCSEILSPEFLWPERTETNSQSFSFQGANLGQIQGFHPLCKIYKLWNPGNRVLYVQCKGKRLQGSTGAVCTAYQRQLQGHLCFSLCSRMYEQCTLLLSPSMQATVKEREKP